MLAGTGINAQTEYENEYLEIFGFLFLLIQINLNTCFFSCFWQYEWIKLFLFQVGTETFVPKHVIIATWKNVSFAGGIPTARRTVRIVLHTVPKIIGTVCTLDLAQCASLFLSVFLLLSVLPFISSYYSLQRSVLTFEGQLSKRRKY